MYRSILHERSEHVVVVPSIPDTWLRLSWGKVLDALLAFEATGVYQPILRPEVQRPGAAGALAVSLAIAQLGLMMEDVRRYGWPSQLAA